MTTVTAVGKKAASQKERAGAPHPLIRTHVSQTTVARAKTVTATSGLTTSPTAATTRPATGTATDSRTETAEMTAGEIGGLGLESEGVGPAIGLAIGTDRERSPLNGS